MADRISEQKRSYNMSRIRSAGTIPEMSVRRTVYSMGRRYKTSDRSLPGRPDMSFQGLRKAIFVHGCFWHQHPSRACADSRVPTSREDYWKPKLTANVTRDQKAMSNLSNMGWAVLVVWECDIETRPGQVTEELAEFLA